jgi:hypothetical protein
MNNVLRVKKLGVAMKGMEKRLEMMIPGTRQHPLQLRHRKYRK